MRLGKDVITTDLYAVLGVPRNATDEQVRRAYRLQVMTSHPDLHGGKAEERMVELNVAACVLLDANRRAEYDRHRGDQRNAHASPPTAERENWYPWTATNSSTVEWSQPIQPERVRLDGESESALKGFRGSAEQSFHRLLDWSNTWPPGTHLTVTFASVCLALALIACAKPSSLPTFHGEEHATACVEDGSAFPD